MADDLKRTGKADDERTAQVAVVARSGVLSLVFTPRLSAEIPMTFGPMRSLRIEGNTLRHGDSGAVLAECHEHHWVINGAAYYRADCTGPVSVTADGCDPPTKFGPFSHFSLSDGIAHVDRAVFARLNSSNEWFIVHSGKECPKLLLSAPG